MFQTSLLLMKSFNKTETPILYLQCVLCFQGQPFRLQELLNSYLLILYSYKLARRHSFHLEGSTPASILHKSTARRYRPISYPDGPIMACYRFMKNAYWDKFIMFYKMLNDLSPEYLSLLVPLTTGNNTPYQLCNATNIQTRGFTITLSCHL